MSKINNHLKNVKKIPLWIIPALFSLMLFSLNGLSTNPDSAPHLNAALDIVNHDSINQFTTGLFKRRPLFSIFIASSFWLFGISIKNAFWVIRFFFLLNVMSIFFIGNKLFNKWVGLVASLFLLTSLTFNEWSSYLLISNILPFFLLWYFYFIFLGMERRSPKYFIFASIFLMSSLFLKEYTIIFLPVLFLMIFTSAFIKGYSTKKLFKLLITVGIILLIIYILWASMNYLSSGHISVSLKRATNLEYIKISTILARIKFILTDKNGNFSLFNFVRNLYFSYIRFISPNFPILIEFLLLFGWGFTLYKAFLGSKPDILLSIFLLISIFIMADMGHPLSDWSFRIIFFLLCFSSLVIGRLIYEIIKKILLISKKIAFLKPKSISYILATLIISLVFGTQISQSWGFYKKKVSLFTGNWGFTVDSWHNDHVKNMGKWISDNIPENSKILSSDLWGTSFYFFSKGKYPINLLQVRTGRNFDYFLDKSKLIFFDYRESFYNENFRSIDENYLLALLKNTSAQYILITPADNSVLSYLNDNNCFEKLHEIHMFPNPGWMTLYKVLDIKPKVSYQGVINRAMMNWLKNLYQTDKSKFNEIKERILKKRLEWSAEDVERRIIREIPSHLANLKLNNKVEFLGYDLIPIIQSKFEIIENEENENRNEQDEIATLPSVARNDDKLVSFEKTEGESESKEKKGLAKEIPILKLGEKFELIFYWKCLEKIDHRYTVWAALCKSYDSVELGHILVDESEYPTTAWKPGEVIKDISQFRVPDYIVPGEYEFKISLYDINERKEITPFTSVGKVKILMPLEGAISRIKEYKKLECRIKSLHEYIEIIKHIDNISNPENRKLLLHALKEIENYKIKDPHQVDINYAIGIGYKKLGNLKKAEEILKKVLKKDSNHSGALIELGKIYYIEKRYQLAAELLEKILLNQENNFEAGLLIKETYSKLGNSVKSSEIDRKLRIISENSVKMSKWDVKGTKSSNPSLPWANVNIGKKILLYGDITKLTLKTKGERAANVLPHLAVWIDDKLLHEGYLKNEEWNDFEFYIKYIEPGQHLLKIWKRGGGPLYLGKLNLIQINPLLDIIMPGEGSVLYMGEGMDIRWVPPHGVDNVMINLYKGKKVARLLANPTQNDGDHWWKIHNDLIEGTNYSIKIESDFYFGYSGYFTIKRKR